MGRCCRLADPPGRNWSKLTDETASIAAGKQAVSLTQKRRAASPTAVVCDPAGNGFAGWKHLTLHFLRVHVDASYAEIVDWASEMDRVRDLLQLARSG